MTYTLEAFVKDTQAALRDTAGPAGREKVRVLLERLLANPAFVDEAVGPNAPTGTRKLYEDKEQGFVVLAHCNPKPHKSPPHDHGPSWAIYGQVSGETKMYDWELVSPAGPDKTGKVKHKKDYTLKPGIAHVYNEGDLHSPSRAGPTRLIRIEGINMENVKRFKYEAV